VDRLWSERRELRRDRPINEIKGLHGQEASDGLAEPEVAQLSKTMANCEEGIYRWPSLGVNVASGKHSSKGIFEDLKTMSTSMRRVSKN
jgi:hypothetical protein